MMKASIRSGFSERSLGSFTSPIRIKAVAATVCICSSVHVYYKKRTVHKLDLSSEIPVRVPTQEDAMPLMFRVLPMKQSCKGRAPSF